MAGENYALAQGRYRWTPPAQIPLYDQSTWTPYLVADQNRTVHAFATDLLDENIGQKGIVYRQWTPEGGWTQPNDVLLSPLKNQARIHGALLDEAGMMHVVFFGGDETQANIYYANAPARLAHDARAWSMPALVGARAHVFDDAVLARDGQGHLHIIYSGDLLGSGLYATRSSDGGETWSEPAPLFQVRDPSAIPYDLQTATDMLGNLHVVWAVNNESGLTDSIHYARLEAGQETWVQPVEIENLGGIPAGTPALSEYNDELILIYHAINPEVGLTRHMRRSSDSGNTWSQRFSLFPHVGSNGAASLVIDGNNVLHMFFGNRVTIGGQITHGMWHSVWQNGQWSPPQAIVSGPKQADFDPSDARAIVSQGDTILVTWMTDPGAIRLGTGGTYYSYTEVEAPMQPISAIPMPSPTLTSSPTEALISALVTTEPALTSLPDRALVDGDEAERTAGMDSPAVALVVGIIPVVLFTTAVVAARKVSRQRRG
jgi:hypothetical protein